MLHTFHVPGVPHRQIVQSRLFYPYARKADCKIAGYLPAPKDASAENTEPDELPGMPETSQDKLLRVYKKALSIAYQAGVVSEVPILNVSINNRLTRAWGRCITTAVLGKPQNCKIEVRKSLVECADELPLLQTLLHEICHTVKDGCRGHKAGFMTAAKKIEAMFSQYRVACATISYKTYGL